MISRIPKCYLFMVNACKKLKSCTQILLLTGKMFASISLSLRWSDVNLCNFPAGDD